LDTRLLFHKALLPVWKGDLIVVVGCNIFHSVMSVFILSWLYCTWTVCNSVLYNTV